MLGFFAPLFQQLPLSEMEHGLAFPLATLDLEPAEITERTGLSFESAQDDLDELLVALLRSETGRQFALVRHLHQPNPGTDILGGERSFDHAADLQEALRILRVDRHDLRWTHPVDCAPGERGSATH